MFSDIHIRAISQEMPQPSVTKIRLKITYLKFHSNFPGANELIENLTFRPLATATPPCSWVNNSVGSQKNASFSKYKLK